MISINCQACKKHCCGMIKELTPILTEIEEERFRDFSKEIITKFRPLRILKKKTNGNCIFLNDETRRCSIYNERPLECRLYPFLLDFHNDKNSNKKKASFKIDKRFCSQLATLKFDKDQINALIQDNKFSNDWIDAFTSLEGY